MDIGPHVKVFGTSTSYGFHEVHKKLFGLQNWGCGQEVASKRKSTRDESWHTKSWGNWKFAIQATSVQLIFFRLIYYPKPRSTNDCNTQRIVRFMTWRVVCYSTWRFVCYNTCKLMYYNTCNLEQRGTQRKRVHKDMTCQLLRNKWHRGTQESTTNQPPLNRWLEAKPWPHVANLA